MGQFSQQQAIIQNVILMGLEAGFSFIVLNDPLLQAQVQKFVEQKIVIKINNYLPLFDIYLQFTDHGVLFDITAPEKKPDLEVRVTPLLLFKILIMGDSRSLRQLRIKGNVELRDHFTDLLLLCTLPKIITDIPKWLFNSSSDTKKASFSQSRITPMLETMAQQREEIRKLKAKIKQDHYIQQKTKKQNRNLKYLCFLLLFALLICSVMLFIK